VLWPRTRGIRHTPVGMEWLKEKCETLQEKLPSRPGWLKAGGSRGNRSSSATDEAESMELVAHRMGLIAPEGKRKVQWDWFVLALVFYTGITVPFCLAFEAFTELDVSPVGFAVDCLVDLCYIADLFVSWRTTYYDREGNLVTDKRMVRNRYLKTWFPLDFIASFPFEWLGDLATINSSVEIPPSVRLPGVLKLARILRLGKKIDRLSSSKMFRIGQFTFMLLFAAHWYACIWYWQGTLVPPDNDDSIITAPGESGTSWVYIQDLQDESLAMRYTASLYWAVTTLMKSPWFHPASPGEFVSALLMIIFGCVLFAYFIGNVTAVITAANAAGGRYRGQIAELKGFCSANNLSEKLTKKLMRYQDAQWTETHGGLNRADIMSRFVPTHLLPDVILEMYKPIITSLPFLFDCTTSGCVAFLRELKVCVCDRGDTLMVAGSVRRTMYILQKGELKIDYDEDVGADTVEGHLPGARIGGPKNTGGKKKKSAKDNLRGRTDKVGTMVGFQDVFKKIDPLKYTVVATSRCSLLAITCGQLKDLLTTYTDDRELFEKAIEQANNTMRNATSGVNRRGSTNVKAAGNVAKVVAGVGKSAPNCEQMLDQIAAEAKAIEEKEKSVVKSAEGADPAAASSMIVSGVSSDEVADLRRKIDTLTKIVSEQFKMMQSLVNKQGEHEASSPSLAGGTPLWAQTPDRTSEADDYSGQRGRRSSRSAPSGKGPSDTQSVAVLLS